MGLKYLRGHLELLSFVSSLIWTFQMKKEGVLLMKFPDQMQGKVFSGLIVKLFWIIILMN